MIGWLNNQPFWRRTIATRYEFKYNLWHLISKMWYPWAHLYIQFQMNSAPIWTKIVKTMVGSWPKLHQTYSNSQVYTRPNLHKSRVKHKACLFESISSIHLLKSHLHTHTSDLSMNHMHTKHLWIWGQMRRCRQKSVWPSLKTFCWSMLELTCFIWCRDPDLRSQNIFAQMIRVEDQIFKEVWSAYHTMISHSINSSVQKMIFPSAKLNKKYWSTFYKKLLLY